MNHEDMKKKFVSIYNAEADAVFRYTLIRISSREVSLDISQEAFMRLWDAMRQNKNISNHRAFLFTITRNLIIDWYRKKKAVSLDGLDRNYREDGDPDPELLDRLILGDNLREEELNAEGRYVLEKIKVLPESYQQVVFMRFVMDLKPKEIAEILKENVNVISVRINRGIEKLKQILRYED